MSEPDSRAPVLRWATAALLLMVAAVLLTQGWGEPGVREVVRWTARTSLGFFGLAFISWALSRNAWPARQRAGLLSALAVSHGLHLLAIAALALHTGGANLAERVSRLAGGALAYAVIFLGAWRPASAWVKWGSFWVWTVFLVSYLPRAIESPIRFGPAVAVLVVAMAIRLWGLVRASRSAGMASPQNAS